jgi:hypothetical protein
MAMRALSHQDGNPTLVASKQMSHCVLRVLAWVTLAALLLSGCASGYLLDNTVQSFSGLTALPSEAGYRFERLPSQQSPAQAQLEALADPALLKAGLRRDDARPRYSVQVTARIQRVLSPWASPWDGWGWGGWGWGPGFWRHHHHHPGFGHFGHFGAFGRMESPWYQREVEVIVRELPSNRAVFESRAFNDGPWLDHATVLAAMFQAVLQGFPNPPPGPRRVNIQIGPNK